MHGWYIALLLLALAEPLAAEEIPGAGDATFAAARNSWLSGNDADALAAMSGLANGGNGAAQLFLGTIERQTYLHEHVTLPLTREARIALLRSPGGLSGRNWLTVAAPAVPLAATFTEMMDIATAASAVEVAAEAGEVRAIVFPVMTLANQGALGPVIEVPLRGELRPYHGAALRVALAVLESGYGSLATDGAPPTRAETKALARRIDAGGAADADRLLWEVGVPGARSPPDPGRSVQLLRASGVLAPQDALCAAICPATQDACLMAYAVGITRSLGPVFLPALSPIESLFSTPEYQASPRFRQDLLAAVAADAEGLAAARAVDACLADTADAAR